MIIKAGEYSFKEYLLRAERTGLFSKISREEVYLNIKGAIKTFRFFNGDDKKTIFSLIKYGFLKEEFRLGYLTDLRNHVHINLFLHVTGTDPHHKRSLLEHYGKKEVLGERFLLLPEKFTENMLADKTFYYLGFGKARLIAAKIERTIKELKEAGLDKEVEILELPIFDSNAYYLVY